MTTAGAAVIQNPSEVAAAQAAQARGVAEGARAQAQAAREQAQAAREQAQAAREQAQDAQNAGQTVLTDGAVITITKDGKTITLDGASPDALAALGIAPPVFHEPDPGPYIMGGIGMIATAIVLIVGLTQRYRIKMRGASAAAAVPADFAQRMARMEAGIESVAVEVERISEGQRFTARLLSERAPVEVPRG